MVGHGALPQFQFQKVRLKVEELSLQNTKAELFQFQKVRLKVREMQEFLLSLRMFQFQKVRLKAATQRRWRNDCKEVSIPKGSIKRKLYKEKLSYPKICFNSKRFD